jgi:hypothetical protein
MIGHSGIGSPGRHLIHHPLETTQVGDFSTLRDRVCMTAAMLVLEPIFEADLPPELYAYRPGRNAQQAVRRRQTSLLDLETAAPRTLDKSQG